MKTFLEVEGKMGPIPQPAGNQYRPPRLDTNPKVRKDNAAEKRKRAVPTKRFRPSTAPKLSETAVQPPATVFKVPQAPESRPPPLEKAQVFKMENTKANFRRFHLYQKHKDPKQDVLRC